MIQIIRTRDKYGAAEETSEYPQVGVGDVTGRLALRFDAELMALKQDGVSLGVRRWTEAAFKVRKFNDDAREWIEANEPDLEKLPEEEQEDAAEAYGIAQAEYLSEHPDWLLAQCVGTWAAVNLGGGHMTLAQVLDLPDRDVVQIADPPPYIADEDGTEGKAPATDS